MKTNYFYQVLFSLFITSSVFSAENNSAKEPVVISGTKFTYPLVEQWIAEYQKVNPNANIKLATKANAGEKSDLSIIAHLPSQSELQPKQEIIYAGRYALLPVTNNNNPLLVAVAKKGLNKKELDKLFFEVVDYDSDEPIQKSKFRANIYSRDNQACASTALAGHYGHQTSEIRGKKVLGDDIYLLSAIKKDTIGLTYNNLGYLYDINTRILKQGIALLPIDLKKEAKTISTGNLDDVLNVLEATKVETIPVEKIGFIYSDQNTRKEVSEFLKWVLSDGQKYNHAKGFLNLDKQSLAEQQNRLSDRFLSLK
jgi:phosphate transport system substrate-binding protein